MGQSLLENNIPFFNDICFLKSHASRPFPPKVQIAYDTGNKHVALFTKALRV